MSVSASALQVSGSVEDRQESKITGPKFRIFLTSFAIVCRFLVARLDAVVARR
jgi:hypothetical protein